MVNPDRIRKLVDAVRACDLGKIRLLLKAGVPADSVEGNFLKNAASCGNAEAFNLLLEYGADINVRHEFMPHSSLLPTAIRGGSIEIARTVLEQADLQPSDLNNSLLILPSRDEERVDLFELLLESGANVGYQDEEGATCLIHAVLFGHEKLALRFLELGADPTAKVPADNSNSNDLYKKSVLEVAKLKGLDRVTHAIVNNPERIQNSSTCLKAFKKPKTITQAWNLIDQWLKDNVPQICLPEPSTKSELQSLVELAADPIVGEALLEIYSKHNGGGQFQLIPMNSGISFLLLDIESIQDVRKQNRELAEIESNRTRGFHWNPDWIPIAENGGGDYLVVNATGNCLHFSHESSETMPSHESLTSLFQELAIGLFDGKYEIDTEMSGLI